MLTLFCSSSDHSLTAPILADMEVALEVTQTPRSKVAAAVMPLQVMVALQGKDTADPTRLHPRPLEDPTRVAVDTIW